MNSVLVFGGRAAVDSESFRWQLLRVPEVSQILKEAQSILDFSVPNSKDLFAVVSAENQEFLSLGPWRALASQILQIGLYRRYQRAHMLPRFLVGLKGSVSALSVALGQQNLMDLIQSFANELQIKAQQLQQLDLLVGESLETYGAYIRSDDTYDLLFEGHPVQTLLANLNKDYLVDQVIVMGSSATALELQDSLPEAGIVEAVAMDPLLSWLVPYLRQPAA